MTSSLAKDSVVFTVVLKAATTGSLTRYGYTSPGDTAATATDPSGTPISRVFPLPGGLIYEKNSSGDRFFAANIHGDVMALTDSSGVKLGPTYVWDPYGQPLERTNVPCNCALSCRGRDLLLTMPGWSSRPSTRPDLRVTG